MKKTLKRSDWIAIFSIIFSVGCMYYQVHKNNIREKEQIKISQKIFDINQKEKLVKELEFLIYEIKNIEIF